MSLLTYFDRFKRIDNLIRLKATGSPKDLSKKLNISERLIYDYLAYMRELGADIDFDETRNSYIYDSPVYFKLGYFPEEISKNEEMNVVGGYNRLFLSNYLRF